MHELSLYGQVPLARHEQVLNILAGLSAMQPQVVYERHILFQPLRSSDQNRVNKKGSTKPTQNIPLAYVQLVKTLTRDDFGKESAISSEVTDTNVEDTTSSWTTRIQEIPEPETKALVLRRVMENSVQGPAIEAYLDQTKHKFVNEYIVEGQRLICKDIILTLHRILYTLPTETSPLGPRTSLPPLEELQLLDTSGAFILEASVRIDDRSKPSLVQAATEQLMWFRNEMKGSVDLRPPERLSLDTRVREN